MSFLAAESWNVALWFHGAPDEHQDDPIGKSNSI